MASIVIKGVYATKSALETAQAETAEAGDTYIVGSKIPYNLYTFTNGAFVKGDAVSNSATDVKASPVEDVYKMKFVGEDGKTVMIRRGLHLGEIHFYVPLED